MRPGLRPNAGGEVAAHRVARNRRNFRIKVMTVMTDKELAAEADYLAGWIRAIGQGAATAYREDELQARLRALHHEASQRGLTIVWDRTTGERACPN